MLICGKRSCFINNCFSIFFLNCTSYIQPSTIDLIVKFSLLSRSNVIFIMSFSFRIPICLSLFISLVLAPLLGFIYPSTFEFSEKAHFPKNKTSLICTRSRTWHPLHLTTILPFRSRLELYVIVMIQYLDQILRSSVDKYRVTLVTSPLHFFGLVHLCKILFHVNRKI